MKKGKSKKKFKKIIFKLSEKQFAIIGRFCASKRLTPNKVFKAAIKEYIVNNYDFNQTDYHISENQLALFDLDDDDSPDDDTVTNPTDSDTDTDSDNDTDTDTPNKTTLF